MLNKWPKSLGFQPVIRQCYEAIIVDNTSSDEPMAPRIKVENHVDDQPCPNLEFYYTNKLYHGADVPRPDIKNLRGCSCRGPCHPSNKKCACARRQTEFVKEYTDSLSGFLYNEHGQLREFGYPIFECNSACSCSPDCRNRVMFFPLSYTVPQHAAGCIPRTKTPHFHC